jgi:DNA polymerase III gamma/tau subunit
MKYLIQNTDAYKRLCAQSESGKNSHAYLLVFDDPTHTKTALREFAKVLLSAVENDYGEYDDPALERIAKLIDGDKYPDCLIYPKNEKRLNVEECESIVEECFVHAVEGEKKIFLIDRFDEALPTAQNKLLKVLEEPHEGVVFLLSARTTYPVLQTVLSRTQKLEILPFSIEEVGACLERNNEKSFSKQEIKMVSALSCGSVGTAESLLETGDYKMLMEDAFELALSPLSRLPVAAKKAGATKNKKELVSLLRLIFRDAAFYKAGQEKHLLLAPEKERIRAVAEQRSYAVLLSAQERLSAAEKEIQFNANFAQCIELCLARILQQ